MRRLIRLGLRLGLIGGSAFALFKLVQSRRASEPELPWVNGVSRRPDLPNPAPTVPTSAAAAAVDAAMSPLSPTPTPPVDDSAATTLTSTTLSPTPAGDAGATSTQGAGGDPGGSAEGRVWVEANGTECPPTHPVKAKLASRLYHLPGMAAYARTKPDRCYPDEASAQADGLTRARR